MKNGPRVECRRVSISMGAIYKAAYGTLSRRVVCSQAIPSNFLRHNSGTNHDNRLSILTRGVATSGGNENSIVPFRWRKLSQSVRSYQTAHGEISVVYM